MIKAIFFDIDGTLLDHSPKGGGRMPPSTLRCLEALRKKGIKLFVATGRIPAMVTFLEDLFPFDGFVTLNGQLALDREGRVLHRMAHHPQDIRKLAELVEADPFPCLVIEEKDSFFMVETPIIREHFQKEGLSAPGSYHIARLEEHPILQFLAYIPKEEAQRRLASLEHIEITALAAGPSWTSSPRKAAKRWASRRWRTGTAGSGRSCWSLETGTTTFGCSLGRPTAWPWATAPPPPRPPQAM